MPTRTVVGRIQRLGGAPWAGALVRFRLAPGSYIPAEQVPEQRVEALTDPDGDFSIPLWTNANGDGPSRYITTLPSGEHFSFVLPPGDLAPIEISALRALGLVYTDPGFESVLTYLATQSQFVGAAALAQGLSEKVNKAGDTMAGPLTVPEIRGVGADPLRLVGAVEVTGALGVDEILPASGDVEGPRGPYILKRRTHLDFNSVLTNNDTATDNLYAKVQEAVDYLRPGGVLDFTPWDREGQAPFRLDGMVTINKPLTIRGTRGAQILVPDNSAAFLNPATTDLLRITSGGVRIHGLNIDGNGTNQYVDIDDHRYYYHAPTGRRLRLIGIQHDDPDNPIDDIEVAFCRLHDAPGGSIGCNRVGGTTGYVIRGIRYLHNRLSKGQRNSITFMNCESAVAIGNTFEDNYFTAIHFYLWVRYGIAMGNHWDCRGDRVDWSLVDAAATDPVDDAEPTAPKPEGIAIGHPNREPGTVSRVNCVGNSGRLPTAADFDGYVGTVPNFTMSHYRVDSNTRNVTISGGTYEGGSRGMNIGAGADVKASNMNFLYPWREGLRVGGKLEARDILVEGASQLTNSGFVGAEIRDGSLDCLLDRVTFRQGDRANKPLRAIRIQAAAVGAVVQNCDVTDGGTSATRIQDQGSAALIRDNIGFIRSQTDAVFGSADAITAHSTPATRAVIAGVEINLSNMRTAGIASRQSTVSGPDSAVIGTRNATASGTHSVAIAAMDATASATYAAVIGRGGLNNVDNSLAVSTGQAGTPSTANVAVHVIGDLAGGAVFVKPSTIAALPAAGATQANRIRMVSNPAAGKGRLVYCDGTAWRYVSDDSAV
jgi:hypothetical protein